jgi:hypothetical protein
MAAVWSVLTSFPGLADTSAFPRRVVVVASPGEETERRNETVFECRLMVPCYYTVPIRIDDLTKELLLAIILTKEGMLHIKPHIDGYAVGFDSCGYATVNVRMRLTETSIALKEMDVSFPDCGGILYDDLRFIRPGRTIADIKLTIFSD